MVKNYPFCPVEVNDLVRDIQKEVYGTAEAIKAFVESKDMSCFDAASIYYFAVRHFPRRLSIWK